MNSLETQVLQIIAEDTASPDVFTDDAAGLALIRGSINDAVQEVCTVTGSYTKTYHLIIHAESQWYRMVPKNDFILFVMTVWDREYHYRLIRTNITQLNLQDMFWMKRHGRPLRYITAGFDYIGLYPYPTEEGKVLELTCACVPLPYSSGNDPIKLREQFQRACVMYAVSEYFASRGDAARAQEYLTRYVEITGIMASKTSYADRVSQMEQSFGKQGTWNLRSGQ